MAKSEGDIQEQADNTVFGFCVGKEIEARNKLRRMKFGKGCLCAQCRKNISLDYLDAADRLDWFDKDSKNNPLRRS